MVGLKPHRLEQNCVPSSAVTEGSSSHWELFSHFSSFIREITIGKYCRNTDNMLSLKLAVSRLYKSALQVDNETPKIWFMVSDVSVNVLLSSATFRTIKRHHHVGNILLIKDIHLISSARKERKIPMSKSSLFFQVSIIYQQHHCLVTNLYV